MTDILVVDDVTVARGELILCAGVSFLLKQGEICHVLGENGLGKTTLLMQVMGLLPTLAGHIRYLGGQTAVGAVFVSHQVGIHESLTVSENLAFLMALYGVQVDKDEMERALAMVGLGGLGAVPARELSAGQGRRVGLARLWLLTPEIAPLWVLDEPLTALDVAMAARLSDRLTEFGKAGGAVLLTSHQPITVANKVVDLAEFVGGYDD